MQQLIHFFIKQKMLVYLLSVLIVAAGLLVASGLRRQILPDVDMLIVQISTFYPAASARDVELNVTVPLEEKLLEVDGVKKLRSVSMENFSQININLDPDSDDIDKVKANIRRAIDQVNDLPSEVTERPTIAEWETSWIPIGIVGLSGLNEMELREIAQRLEKEIESISGVAHVDKLAYRDPEIKVQISLEKLKKYYLSLQDVANAIKSRNVRLTGGALESYSDETSVLTLSEFNSPEEIANVIVRSNFEGQKIRIRDLADIKEELADQHMEHRVNGLSGVALRIHKKKSADSIKVMNRVNRYLKKLDKQLPEKLIVQKVRDTTQMTERRLGILKNNAIIGFVLLIAILIIFLNLRVALWTAMGIPISLAVGAMFHAFTGGSNDSISIMVFILVLGMLVDDAIVVAENIHRHQENGMPKAQAAIEGVKEVFAPIMATISTTIVAFLPLFSLGGMLGLFIRMIPIIIMGTLLGSVLESFLFLPSHLAAGKDKTDKKKEHKALADRFFKPMQVYYRKLLASCLRHKFVVVIVSLGLLGTVGYLAGNHMKFVLFPNQGAEEAFAYVETTIGSSYQATLDKVLQVEALVSQLPEGELEDFETFVGMAQTASGAEMYADNLAMIYLKFTAYGKRKRTATDILNFLREKTKNIKGVKSIEFHLDSGGPPVGRPVELNIVGDNEVYQKKILDEVMVFLQGISGVLDPTSDLKQARDEEVIQIDHDTLAELGLTVADVANTIRMAFEGDVVSSVRFIRDEVDIRVRLDKKDRTTKRTLEELMVRNNTGKLIALKQFISSERRPALQGIRHFSGQRVVTISADLDNKKITAGEVNEKIVAQFENVSQLYPGMRIVVSGEAEESKEVMANMGKAGLLALLAIYSILVLLLNSFAQPFIILVAIPFGVIGVIVAFLLHGMSIGFMAMLGILGMSGVVVNDSLIILSFIHHLAKDRNEEKQTSYETILDGAVTRLRPVVLTTVTTSVALLPTAYGIGGSDPFVQPMVMAMLWGIVFATTLTLFWVPTLFAIGQESKKKIQMLIGKFCS